MKWSLASYDEGSTFLRALQKYVRKTKEPASATGDGIFHPTALTGLDHFETIYPR